MAKSRYKFNGKKFGNSLYKRIADEQTNRLIAYAQEELDEIVLSREFDDRTRNLADSYIWCVYFQGKRKGFGTYGNKQARKQSLLHEYSPEMSVTVNGRKLAMEFARAYKPKETKGWEIVFSACAPYGAYLEAGFTLRCFQRLSFPYIATQLCRWHDNWCTIGTSIPVLSY